MTDYPYGCNYHLVTDCGCLGYPSIQDRLRGYGDACADLKHTERCLLCQGADMIDRYKTRSERYLERIIELQETNEELTPPAGHVSIHIPIETVERIVTTDRMFPTLEQLRDAIHAAWEGQ